MGTALADCASTSSAVMPSMSARSCWSWRRRGVRTGPGWTQLTRTPSAATSSERFLVTAATPALVTALLAPVAPAVRSAPPPMTTMRPPPRARMWGTTSRERRTKAMSLTSMWLRQASSGRLRTVPEMALTALLTRMSTPPNSATVEATRLAMSSGDVTSARRGRTRLPVASSISRAASCSGPFASSADGDGGAFLRQRHGRRLADAHAAARDDGDLVSQA